MKNTLIRISMVMVFFPIVALAEFSANVALTTDYVWRGVSQTEGDPAIQGSVEYAHDSGFYAGVWASNASFVDDSETDVEINYYAGYSREYDSGFSWDVSAYIYKYPGSSIETSHEYFLVLGYDMFSATIARDFENKNDYYQLAAEMEVGNGIMLAGHVGEYDFNDGVEYTNYRLALSKEIKGFNFELSYTDTDFSDTECLDFSGADNLCDGRFIFTLSTDM